MIVAGAGAPAAQAKTDEITWRKGEPMPDELRIAGLNDPAPRFMRQYTDEIFGLLGATAVSYSSRDYSTINLRFATRDFAIMADSVLKDEVLGAKLVFQDRDRTTYDLTKPGSEWTRNPSNLARNIAAMNGVQGYRWLGRTILFEPTSTESRVELQQLVNRKLGDTGVIGYWKGECFGPGCTPDPKPPTGEWPER